jgi:hypothetical protein
VHGGPRAVLTAFTAAEAYGLRGWERKAVHLLVPNGTRLRPGCPVPVRQHVARDWNKVVVHRAGGVHVLSDALLRASATFDGARPGCGLLAAAVQQRLIDTDSLREALGRIPTARHHRSLLAAVEDIAQGAQALSEIDFVRLCRRFALPAPRQQTVRHDRDGHRRYIDATWRRCDGRLVAVEVDGALHLAVSRWWADQLRQNELSLSDVILLRYPSVVVREEPALVAAQLRRALLL